MKNAKMNINFEQDTVQALNQELPLSLTQSGHYILPLSLSTQLIQEINQPTFQDTDTVTLHVCEIAGDNTNVASIASKLHHQFAYAPAQKLLHLVSHAGSPWANNSALKTQIHQTVDNCSTCNLYKKPPPHPVVGLPLATMRLWPWTWNLEWQNHSPSYWSCDKAVYRCPYSFETAKSHRECDSQ